MSDQPKQATPSETVSLGALLRQAREQRGLNIDAIAASLHLDRRIVLALEEGRQGELPAQTYVRGYVRTYARLVGLDADQLVAIADAAAVDRPLRPTVLPPPSKPSLADRAHRHWGWVFGGIVAAVLVATAVVLWTVASSFDWSLPWRTPVEEEVEPSAATTNAEVLPTPEVAAPPTSESIAERQPESQVESPTESPPDESVQDAFADQAANDEEGEEPAAADQAASDEELAAADAPPADIIQDTLLFHFNESSWVEVRDGDNKLIHSDLGKTGATVQVQGKVPFDILIGYALGVRLTFNGDDVALGPHTRQNVARLVVGQ